MAQLTENVKRIFRKSGIRSLLVAVSGGADSVALLRLCHDIANTTGIRVEAANCNFHLRGEESERDSEFTVSLCKKLGIKIHTLGYDVDKHLRQHPGTSMEMACRELRYHDFFRLMDEEGFDRIAVAHNSDDDIETMLLNMLRGCGSRGLKGMDIDTGRIIRPLLGVSRKEIERYLASIGQDFITDSSNLRSDYRRNYLRREVLPLLEKRWPGARKALGRTVNIMKEDSQIVEDFHTAQMEKLVSGNRMNVYDPNVRIGTIMRFLQPYGGNAAMAEEIFMDRGLRHGERRWRLGDDHEAILERDSLVIMKSDTGIEVTPEWSESSMTAEGMKEIKSNRSHEAIYLPSGADKYYFRKPSAGDRIAPLGMKGTRLVSDVISDAKLDWDTKSKVRVLVRKSDEKIIWVTGLKRSRYELTGTEDKKFYKCVFKISDAPRQTSDQGV